MKRLVAAIAGAAILAGLHPAVALAQAPKAAPEAVAPAPAPVAAAPAAHAKKRAWTRADARVCLEFPTNLQIIRCAEKYRYTRVPT
jgi:hypothetical protein